MKLIDPLGISPGIAIDLIVILGALIVAFVVVKWKHFQYTNPYLGNLAADCVYKRQGDNSCWMKVSVRMHGKAVAHEFQPVWLVDSTEELDPHERVVLIEVPAYADYPKSFLEYLLPGI